MNRCFLIFTALTFVLNARSQLVVQNNLTPNQIINDVLLGEGVEAENITFNNATGNSISTQFGTFNSQNSNIGLSQGIILATGGVSVANSPNDLPTAHVLVPEADELTEEPDLAQLMAPAALNDVATVEFDFTPRGDTLRFTYVFASEEYNEHTCSPYNDAFGFFISGPGIPENTDYENNAQNMALVPGKNVPVAINTVNRGYAGTFGSNSVCNAQSTNWQENSAYFINNESNSDLNATQFDGFTTPMTIEIPVVCGATYHIKLAIADATDGKNDSAVFIEAGSFESLAPLEAELQVLNPDTAGNAVEGCSTYQLRLDRIDSLRTETVYLQVVGLDNANEILPNMPDSVTLYALDGVKTISFDVADNLDFEEFRSFKFQILQIGACSQDTSVIDLPSELTDFPPLEISHPDSIALDCIEAGNVDMEVSGGYPPYQVIWDNPQAEGFNFSVSPDSIMLLTGQVSDQCGVHTRIAEITIYREQYDAVQVVLPDTIAFNCADPVSILPQISGGYGDYDYTWTFNGEVLSNAQELNTIFPEDGTLIFRVNDRCMPFVEKSIELKSQLNPLTVNVGSDTVTTCVDPVVIVPEVSGGFGQLSYVWKVNGLAQSSASIFSPLLSQTSGISLEVIDECGQSAVDGLFIQIDNPPLKAQLPTDTSICKGETLVLDPKVSGGFGGYTVYWNNAVIEAQAYSVTPKGDEEYAFSVVDECGVSLEQTVSIQIREVEARFEFDYESQFHPIKNRSTANCWYNWSFPDGSTSNVFEPAPDQAVLVNGKTFLTVRNDIGCEAEKSKWYEPPLRIFIPTAFTPDGDGVNDIFKVVGRYITQFEIQIFDRWGNAVFSSTSLDHGWDGSVDQSAYAGSTEVYSYKYRATDFSGVVHQGTGTIQLLR